MLEKLLNQLAEEMEMPQVGPKDEQHMYHFPLNEQIRISFKELDPGILFFSPIGPIPDKKKEELVMRLMKANFLGQGTGGGAIGLDPEEKLLTLSLNLPYDMNYKTFKGALEDFANFVDYWREDLIKYQQDAENSLYS